MWSFLGGFPEIEFDYGADRIWGHGHQQPKVIWISKKGESKGDDAILKENRKCMQKVRGFAIYLLSVLS